MLRYKRRGKDENLVKVVQSHEKERILRMAHDDQAHKGKNWCTEHVSSRYYWRGMSKDISDYVKACKRCQANPEKLVQPKITLKPVS